MNMRPFALRLQYLFVALGLAAAMPLQTAQAAQWMDVATISSTIGNTAGRLCTGAGKTDIGCPAYAPYVNSSGLVGIGTAAPTTALHVQGTLRIATGGEACDANRVGAIKYESGSFAICQSPANGWENLATTGENSLADRITSNSMAGVIANQTGYISLTTGGVTGTVYFTPGGRLIVQGVSSTGIVSATRFVASNPGSLTNPSIELPGTGNGLYMYAPQSIGLVNNSKLVFSVFADTVEMNMPMYGEQSYSPRVEHTSMGLNIPGFTVRDRTDMGMGADGASGMLSLVTNNAARLVVDQSGLVGVGTASPTTRLDVSGTLKIANGGEACDADRLGAIRYTSNNFQICRNGSTWETMVAGSSGTMDTDRITSGTTAAVIANQTGGTVSFTLGSTPGAAYMHPVQGFVGPGVSTTGTISGTSGYMTSLRVGNAAPFTNSINPFQSYMNVVGDNSSLAGIEMRNLNNGVSAEFRFVVSDERGQNGQYLAFGMPSSNNNATLFGMTRSQMASVFVANGLGASGGRALALGTVTNNAVVLGTNNAERLRVTGAGLVGLGTLTPTTALDVSGTLRIANGGEACDANRLGAIRYLSNNFQICRNGSTWETMVAGNSGTMDTDRITSSTTAGVIANQAGGTVSFTLGSTPGAAYMHPVLGLVTPGVSATGTVSGAIVATPLVRLLGVSGSAGVSMTQAGDNLGNHTATQDLDMAAQNIINAGSITASGNIKTTAAVQAGNTDTTCAGAADYGKMRFDSATKKLFLCRP